MEQINNFKGVYEIHLNGPNGQPGVYSVNTRRGSPGKKYLIVSGKNYHKVTMFDGLNRKTRTIHSLVAEHFVNKPDCDCCDKEKMVVDHMNQNSFDNRVQNLRWVPPWFNNMNTDKRLGYSKHTHGKYQVRTSENGKDKYMGLYDTIGDAQEVYDNYKKNRMDKWLNSH